MFWVFRKLLVCAAIWLALTTLSFATYPSINSSSSGTAGTSAGTTGTVVLPATINANDLIVVFAWQNVPAGGSTVTAPAFTTAFNGNTAGENISVLYKVAAGTEGGTSLTITWTSSAAGQNYIAYAVSGASTIVPLQVSSLTAASTSTPSSSSLSPTWGNRDVLWFDAIGGVTASAATVSAYPAGFTLGQLSVQNSGNTTRNLSAVAMQQTTGTQAPGAWIFSAAFNSGGAITVGVLPAQPSYPINIPMLGF